MPCDTVLLRFQVQGSAAMPYRLTAEGIGAAFRIFCSCPAGRKARIMCKHAAALLMGDITDLVHPSDSVDALTERAVGSTLPAAALKHRPTAKPSMATLDAGLAAGLPRALATIIAEAESFGFVMKAEQWHVGLHKLSKFGMPLKHPHIWITYEAEGGAPRPFVVGIRDGDGKRFGHLERAAAHFLAAVHQYRLRSCP